MGKRTAGGVIIAVLAWTLGNELIDLLDLPIPALAQSFAVSLLGSGLGAYVARRNFLVPALCVLVACWGFAIYVLYLIAAPTGQGSIAGILRYNSAAIVLSVFATLIGVLGGQAMARRAQGVDV